VPQRLAIVAKQHRRDSSAAVRHQNQTERRLADREPNFLCHFHPGLLVDFAREARPVARRILAIFGHQTPRKYMSENGQRFPRRALA
jgi:hypothetical protein